MRIFFILCGVILLGVNSFYLFATVMSKYNHRHTPIMEPGAQFAEFRPVLASISDAGYLTNTDMTPEKNSGEFLQAQYFLAPTVLHPHDPEHRWLVLNYSTNKFMFYALKKYNAQPVIDNKFAKVLAKRPDR